MSVPSVMARVYFLSQEKASLAPSFYLQHFEALPPAHPSAAAQDPPLPPRYHFCMSVQQLPCTHGVPKASGGLWAQQTPSAELWPAGLCWWAAASTLPEPWAGNAGTPAPLRSSVTFMKYKVPPHCGSHRAARGCWWCCSASDGAVSRGTSFASWMWLS